MVNKLPKDTLNAIPYLTENARTLIRHIFTIRGMPHLSKYIGNVQVVLGQADEHLHLYYVVVPLQTVMFEVIEQVITTDVLKEIIAVLDEFCIAEDPIFQFTHDGVRYDYGDGDDSLAVKFHDNAFYIWLRAFAEED